MANPDLWNPWFGGEKPMDLAYLSATVRSTVMPPLDPWFSGGAINYYYFGHFIVAAMIKATGIPATTAFNLAVPLFFALTAGGAFSLGYNLAEGARLALRRRGGAVAPAWSAVCAGLAAVLFVVVLGNLDGAMQLAQRAWEDVVRGNALPAFDYWRSSRMMPPDPPGFEITEFPFFTFLFADLHAHLMALPLTLLVLALGTSNLLGAYGGASLRARLPVLAALGLALGALWATNAWDGPTYLGFSIVILGVGEWVRRRRAGLGWVRDALVASALVVGAAAVLWLPYHLRLTNTLDGIIPAPVQTTLWRYLAIHGVFIFLAGSFLAAALWRERAYLSALGRRLLDSTVGRYLAVAGTFPPRHAVHRAGLGRVRHGRVPAAPGAAHRRAGLVLAPQRRGPLPAGSAVRHRDAPDAGACLRHRHRRGPGDRGGRPGAAEHGVQALPASVGAVRPGGGVRPLAAAVRAGAAPQGRRGRACSGG